MNRYTPRAQQILAIAGDEARRFNHTYIGSEHLLLGILKQGEGVGIKVMNQLGIDLSAIVTELERLAHPAYDSAA